MSALEQYKEEKRWAVEEGREEAIQNAIDYVSTYVRHSLKEPRDLKISLMTHWQNLNSEYAHVSNLIHELKQRRELIEHRKRDAAHHHHLMEEIVRHDKGG